MDISHTLLAQKDRILDYLDCPVPAVGHACEVAPGVRWLRMPLPIALDHINLWLIADDDKWVAIDSGIGDQETQQHWETLLADHTLSNLIVTHMHPDHIGCAAWLVEKTGVPLWMSLGEITSANLTHQQAGAWAFSAAEALYASHGLSPKQQAAMKERGNRYNSHVPTLPKTFQRLIEGNHVHIGEHSWDATMGYGHSPEHLSLYSEEQGILIAGDMILPRISPNVVVLASAPDDNPLGLYLESINYLRELPEDTLVLPSHGRPFRGLHQRIAQLEAHHELRFELILGACRTPKTAAELIPVVFDRPIEDANSIFFALGEAIAHLNYLHQRGDMRREFDQGSYLFQSNS